MGAAGIDRIDLRRSMACIADRIKIDLEGKALFAPETVGVLPKDAPFLVGIELLSCGGRMSGSATKG